MVNRLVFLQPCESDSGRSSDEDTATDFNRCNVAEPASVFTFAVKGLKSTKQSRSLKGAQDWQMLVDLSNGLHFLVHIAITNERPGIVIWSDSCRRLHLVELTVPWDGNFMFANERRRTRYEPFRANCTRISHDHL